MYKNQIIRPAIVGLGYVGFPLLQRIAKRLFVLGYDKKKSRIKELNKGINTNEHSKKKFINNERMFFTNTTKDLANANFYIVCVPTPVKKNNTPDLSYLLNSSRLLANYLKKGDIIFFESTVYPGVTNKCIKIIEEKSSLIENKDFFVGYSPERVNPGDSKKTIQNITKIVAFNNKKNFKKVKSIYSLVSKKIIFSTNILEAETSKVIENIQRDLNIALINEIFMVCNKINVNFDNVIKLAETKWNFIKFKPGLVGGHCLPVDPYYFSYLASSKGVKTNIILAGRKVNNFMKSFIENKIISNLKLNKEKKILLCGLTYKENVSDIRNSQAIKIFESLKRKKFNIIGYDPYVKNFECKKYKVKNKINNFNKFDKIIVLTRHKEIMKKISKLSKSKIFFPF